MSRNSITPFQRRLENWEIMHFRQTMSTASDKIANAISQHTKKLTEKSNEIIVSQDRIATGIEVLSIGIDRLSSGLEGLAAAFDWGFSEIVWQLEQERALLVDIKEILEAPLDTQSKELRKRAEEAYKNGWMEEALEDFLESEKKNRYDFFVHQYLGNIYFFEKKNPEMALSYYEKALKYSAPKSPYHASLALLHIALIRYLQEDFQKAFEASSKAIELTPDLSEAHFQHAQYCSLLGKNDLAIKHLREAAKGDLFYLVKADAEKDFDMMKKQLVELFDEIRNKLKLRAEEEINRAQELIQDAKSYVHNYTASAEILESSKDKLQKAKTFFKLNSIFDYFDSFKNARIAKKEALKSLINSLKGQISDTDNEYRLELDKDKKKKESLLGWAFWICPGTILISWLLLKTCGVPLALGVLVLIIIYAYSKSPFANKKSFEDKINNLRNKLSKSEETLSQLQHNEVLLV